MGLFEQAFDLLFPVRGHLKKGDSEEPAPPTTPPIMGGDDQSLDQSGKNENEQKNEADTNQVTQIDGRGGSGDNKAGRNVSNTTISPVVSPVTDVAAQGQSQASSQANANNAVQGQQHQQVQASYDVQGAQQSIAVPVTVDMSRSATTTAESSLMPMILGIAAIGALVLLRPKQRRRSTTARGRRSP